MESEESDTLLVLEVYVSHNIVVEPWTEAFSRITTLTSWKARPGSLKETSSETLCSFMVEEVDVHNFRWSSDVATNTRAPEPTESERTSQHTTQDEGMKSDLWRFRHSLEFPR